MNGVRFVPTAVHGVLDYLVGIVLILAPVLFGFTDVGGAAVALPRLLGGLLIFYSLLTNYELGIFKLIPMPYHLMVDFIAALLLAISPWLFHFSDQPSKVWYSHVVVGIAVLIVSLCTKMEPKPVVA